MGSHLKTSYIPLSTSRFPIRVVPRFSRDLCRIRFLPANRLPVRFPTKSVSRFAATQPNQNVPSPNSQNKRRSRRSDEGTSAGYATALPLLCAPCLRSPERNNDTSLIPQNNLLTNELLCTLHTIHLTWGRVHYFHWNPKTNFPKTALEPK